jgi:hypothetical protein
MLLVATIAVAHHCHTTAEANLEQRNKSRNYFLFDFVDLCQVAQQGLIPRPTSQCVRILVSHHDILNFDSRAASAGIETAQLAFLDHSCLGSGEMY